MSVRGREGRWAATRLRLEQDIQQFIELYAGSNRPPASVDFTAYGSSAYVRYNYFKNIQTFVFARVVIREENRSQGIFRHLLACAELCAQANGYDRIAVECVLNKRLQDFLKRRGYKPDPHSTALTNSTNPTFYLQLNKGPQ